MILTAPDADVMLKTLMWVAANATPTFLFCRSKTKMEKLLLFDLDNTLLGNDMGTFLPAYFQSLQEALPGIDPDRMIQALAQATQATMANEAPDRLLETVFEDIFFPALGIEKHAFAVHLERYYRERFPEVRKDTRVFPQAGQVVAAAKSAGALMAVATNPLFPATAIYQRLHWAGFSSPDELFSLVTTMENMHFAKPNPSYYAEIAARLGWPDMPAVMIGDDAINDIGGAKRLGLATYHVRGERGGSDGIGSRHGSGPLEKVLDWVAGMPESDLEADFGTPEAVLAIARSTWAALHYWLKIEGAAWDWRAREGGWSIREIICHLRDVEKEGFAARLDLFDSEGTPFIPGLDTESWYQTRDYENASGESAYHEFAALRKQTIARLASRDQKDWHKAAQHAIFGPTTFLESMGIMADHDRIHVRQIAEIIRSQRSGRIE